MPQSPRVAARAIILIDDRLLLVNAYRGMTPPLWCAPGGGVERGDSLPDNLAREVYEETGLTVAVGEPCLINEFHDPNGTFHQIDLYFRCTVVEGQVDDAWRDPEGIVSLRKLVTHDELKALKFKPDSLGEVAFGSGKTIQYDPLEPIVR